MGETCKRHEGMGVIGKCQTCGTPICRECRDEFGYFCSKECLEKSRGTVDTAAKSKAMENLEKGMRLERIMGLSFKIIGALIVVCAGYFVWSLFLAPYGKLAWNWKGEVSPEREFIRLEPQSRKILVFSGPFATAINAAKGQPVAGVKGDEIQRLEHFDGRIGSASLLHGDSCAGLMADDCTFLWFKDFKGQRVMSVANDQSYVILLLMKDYRSLAEAKSEEGPASISSILCVKASDGSTVWTAPLPARETASSLCAANGRFAYLANGFEKNEYYTALKVCDSASGEAKWQVKIKGYSFIPPLFAGDALIFASGGTLNAVSADGAGKLWSLKIGKNSFLQKSSFKFSDGWLIFPAGKGLVCMDVRERKIAWERSLPCEVGDFRVDAGKIFVMGYQHEAAAVKQAEEEAATEVKAATLEDLKDSELTPAGLMGKMSKGFKKEKVILVALDLKDGKELWRKDGAVGRLVCGDGRVALVVDTAKDLMISVIGGSMKGETGITQLSASNGKKIASGSDKIGLQEPLMICGDKLLGVVYDREGAHVALGMGKAPPIQHLGIAAFKLK